jgi:hypothetical protein
MSSQTSESFKLFVTPVEKGTRWQEISQAVYGAGITDNVGYVSLRQGIKNDFAVVTVHLPQYGMFKRAHIDTLAQGKFIKLWNKDGTRYWKAFMYRPAERREESRIDAVNLLTALAAQPKQSMMFVPCTPPGSPPSSPRKVIQQTPRPNSPCELPSPQCLTEELEKEDTVSDISEESIVEQEAVEQEEAGLTVDYSDAPFLEKFRRKRLRIRVKVN